MFCRQCGNEIKPGAKFCSKCGTPVAEEETPKTDETKETQEAKAEEPKREMPHPEEAAEPKAASVQSQAPVVVKQAPVAKVEKKADKTKNSAQKRKNNHLVIGILAACAVLVVALAVVVGIFVVGPMFADSDRLIYLQNDKLYYLKDMSKPDKAVRFDRVSDMSYIYGSYVDEGKYFIYETEEDGNTYTLNRVKLTGLKEGNADKRVEELATDVTNHRIVSKDLIYYVDDKDRLIRYNKGEEEVLEKKVDSFSLDNDTNRIYYVAYDEDEELYSLYTLDLSNGKSEELDKEIDSVMNLSRGKDEKYLFYRKSRGEDEQKTDLYVYAGSGEPKRIAKDVWSVEDYDGTTGNIYYTTQQTEKKTYYDFVDDPTAEADGQITEPVKKDYLQEVSESVVFDDCMSETMRSNYLTGNEADKQRYYNEYLSYDDDMGMYWDYGINNTSDDYYYDAATKKWYVDNDACQQAYQDAWEKYNAIEDKVYLRESLKEMEYEAVSYSICLSEGGKEGKELVTGVTQYQADAATNLVMYTKRGEEMNKVSIDSIEYASDVSDFIDENGAYKGGETAYCVAGGKEAALEIGMAYVVSSNEKDKLLLCASEQKKDGSYKSIYYYAQIKDGKLTTTELCDSLVRDAWVGDTLYYIKDLNKDGDEGTFAKYENGKETELIKDMAADLYSLGITEDGNLILDEDDTVLLYTMDGEKTKISGDVYRNTYLNKNKIVYLTNSDKLYLYNGKKDEVKIAGDVDDYEIYAKDKVSITYAQTHD